MSHALKNNYREWRPSAEIKTLKLRADILRRVRYFFQSRHVLEVETPLLCYTSVTDPFIKSIPAEVKWHGNEVSERYYLQTSPEYAMKRLLAAGSGDIFQISKAFRQSDIGNRHNPEFTIMEWYRLDFDHHALMDEMDELLQYVLHCPSAERVSYADLFLTHCGFNPHTVTLAQLEQVAKQYNLSVQDTITDPDTWLMLLQSHVIEPKIGQDRPIFIYDFPKSQSALARIQNTNPPVASRFEVYFKGMELANGFHELQHADEQRQRFEKNLAQRASLGLETLPIDENFLAALNHGLPNCAGVAVGMDRLVMLALEKENIQEVISFDFSRVTLPF